MAKIRAGRERQLYRGTAGSQATTHVDANVVDVNVDKSGGTRVETTHRGDGSSIPIMTEQVVKRACTVEFTMLYKDGDTNFSAFAGAAVAGSDIALLVYKYSGGAIEFDGDVTLTMNSPGGLKEGMLVTFNASPTLDSGRTPDITDV